MQTSPRTFYKNELLFQSLDQDSNNLKNAAEQLVHAFEQCEKLPEEVKLCQHTLRKFKTTPIEYFDDLFMELNMSLFTSAEILKKMEENHPSKIALKNTQAKWEDINKKFEILMQEIISFFNKACELNQKN